MEYPNIFVILKNYSVKFADMNYSIYFCNRKNTFCNISYMNIKDRFKMIMEREKLTAGAFAESIGVAQATISHILGPRNKYPSTEVILRLHQRYSDINLDWLLTGQGNMSHEADSSALAAEDIGANYPLFAENAENAAKGTDEPEKRKEMSLARSSNASKEIVKQEIVYKERPPRKITEIRIFFDDNTYETFKPA